MKIGPGCGDGRRQTGRRSVGVPRAFCLTVCLKSLKALYAFRAPFSINNFQNAFVRPAAIFLESPNLKSLTPAMEEADAAAMDGECVLEPHGQKGLSRGAR